jgi:hypothetical protein
MREALNAYQWNADPIWKAFEAYVDNSQERMKPAIDTGVARGALALGS